MTDTRAIMLTRSAANLGVMKRTVFKCGPNKWYMSYISDIYTSWHEDAQDNESVWTVTFEFETRYMPMIQYASRMLGGSTLTKVLRILSDYMQGGEKPALSLFKILFVASEAKESSIEDYDTDMNRNIVGMWLKQAETLEEITMSNLSYKY